MCEHTTTFITPEGDPVCHAISIRKFQGSETSDTLPWWVCTGCCYHHSQGWQLTCNSIFYHLRGEKAHCFQRHNLLLTALYPKKFLYKVARLDKLHTSLKRIIVKSEKKCALLSKSLHLTLWRPISRCSFSQWSSLIDSAFCFNRSSRYSCPRFAKSDSEKENRMTKGSYNNVFIITF